MVGRKPGKLVGLSPSGVRISPSASFFHSILLKYLLNMNLSADNLIYRQNHVKELISMCCKEAPLRAAPEFFAYSLRVFDQGLQDAVCTPLEEVYGRRKE